VELCAISNRVSRIAYRMIPMILVTPSVEIILQLPGII
jgi:hypothetical protein